jgi:hypothetical protein
MELWGRKYYNVKDIDINFPCCDDSNVIFDYVETKFPDGEIKKRISLFISGKE